MTAPEAVTCPMCGNQEGNETVTIINVSAPKGPVIEWACPVCVDTFSTFTLDPADAELQQLRRWVLAVTLGRATKETHAEMREYLRRIGW